MIHYSSLGDLNKFKEFYFLSPLHEESSEVENINFLGCYENWLKDGIYAFTNIGVEILMYIQVFILAKGSFYLTKIQ